MEILRYDTIDGIRELGVYIGEVNYDKLYDLIGDIINDVKKYYKDGYLYGYTMKFVVDSCKYYPIFIHKYNDVLSIIKFDNYTKYHSDINKKFNDYVCPWSSISRTIVQSEYLSVFLFKELCYLQNNI